MINLDEILQILKNERIELPDADNFNLSSTLQDQGFDSMTRADMYITLGDFYKVELLNEDEKNLDTFEKIIEYIKKAKE